MKLISAIFVICSMLVLFSCSEKTQVSTAEVKPKVVEYQSYNIVHNLMTYKLSGTEEKKPGFVDDIRLQIGESIIVFGNTVVGITPTGEIELVHIRNSDGYETWIPADRVIANAKLGVVIDDSAIVYDRRSLANPTNDVIPRRTLVAVAEEEEQTDFLEIVAYNEELDRLFSRKFLKNDVVSTENEDVQSAILLHIALGTTQEIAKKELLENAGMYTGSIFAVDVNRELAAILEKTQPGALPPNLADIEIANFTIDGVVNANDTAVYRYPQADSGNVLGTLSRGTNVSTMQKTAEAFEVNGETSSWYRISNPDGWVFGARIDPK